MLRFHWRLHDRSENYTRALIRAASETEAVLIFRLVVNENLGPVEKHYISPGDLLRDAYELAWQVFDSGYRPDYLIGIWRGGTPVAIALHELLDRLGISPDHLAIRTVSYTGIAERTDDVQVDGLDYLRGKLTASDHLLLVDNVHDTGLSLQRAVHELEQICEGGLPEIRIATPWYKPGNDHTQRVPDYYVHKCDDWLVFPHELAGLAWEELVNSKPELAQLLDRLAPHLAS